MPGDTVTILALAVCLVRSRVTLVSAPSEPISFTGKAMPPKAGSSAQPPNAIIDEPNFATVCIRKMKAAADVGEAETMARERWTAGEPPQGQERVVVLDRTMARPPNPPPALEDLARRRMHRRAGVAAVCRSPAYIEALLQSSTGVLAAVPEPPDPEDMAVSKRSWERSMKLWRASLKFAIGHRLLGNNKY